jgi:hypothetical protein
MNYGLKINRMSIPYIDTFVTLNPHLTTNKDPAYGITSPVYTMTRNPPIFAKDSDIVRANLQRVFQFSDTLFDGPHTVVYPFLIENMVSQSAIHTSETIVVDYRWSTEYYHFLTEVLPNAIFLQKRHPHARIFVRESAFTEPMFRWFGLTNFITPRVTAMSKQWVCPFVECGNPSPEKIQLLRSVILQKVTFQQTHGILMRRHKTRVLENEEEVFQCLKTKYPHLQWVIYDVLPPNETADLFSKANMIVGPHGAGFTNMIFSPPGLRVVEFMPLSEPNLCYWHLSECLGHQYTMIPLLSSASPSLSMIAVDYIDSLPSEI